MLQAVCLMQFLTGGLSFLSEVFELFTVRCGRGTKNIALAPSHAITLHAPCAFKWIKQMENQTIINEVTCKNISGFLHSLTLLPFALVPLCSCPCVFLLEPLCVCALVALHSHPSTLMFAASHSHL